MRRLFLLFFFTTLILGRAYAQFEVGTVGLLHLPTADMEHEGTFRVGGGWLNKEAIPLRWWYNTFNYYLDVTLFSFLELSYDLTLFSNEHMAGSNRPIEYFKRWANQDRNFSARLRLIKEGQFRDWMPQIVAGGNDIAHTLNSSDASDAIGIWDREKGNGSFGRLYLAATKHVAFENVGNLGVHVAYLYNNKKKEDYRYKGVGAGADFRFQLPGKGNFFRTVLNGLDLKAEYDTRKVNVGFTEYLFRDRLELTGELFACKYPSVGVTYKVKLIP